MKKMFHAKAQRRKALPRFYAFFFAPLRLCVRTLSSLIVLNFSCKAILSQDLALADVSTAEL